jgi:hypothetical protein
MISTLMISESLFEASLSVAANTQAGLHAEYLAPASLAWGFNPPCCPHRFPPCRPFTSCPITSTI